MTVIAWLGLAWLGAGVVVLAFARSLFAVAAQADAGERPIGRRTGTTAPLAAVCPRCATAVDAALAREPACPACGGRLVVREPLAALRERVAAAAR